MFDPISFPIHDLPTFLMQSTTIHALPTEALCSILGLIPKTNQKDLRFVNRMFNDILKRTLLSSIIFNVHQGSLDLSLFETLAINQNGPEPTGLAVLVKQLTIVSLDARKSIKKPIPHPPSRVDITICQRRLASLLGQALYGLRKITHLNWAAELDQPSTICSIITRWISRQLVRLEVLNLPYYQQNPRVIGSLNTPSLSTLREVVADLAGFPEKGSVQQLQNIIPHVSGLQKLDIELDSLSDLDSLFRPRLESCGANSATELLITHLGIGVKGDGGGAISAHTLDRLSSNLQSLKLDSSLAYGGELPDEDLESIWTQMQPHHFVSLTSLHTNTLSRCLIRHLVQFFPNLHELGLAIENYYDMRQDDYHHRIANAFFDDAVPALASRLEKLEINVVKMNAAPWCFGGDLSDKFKDMIVKMGQLRTLKVSVLGKKSALEGADSEQALTIVNLFVSHAMENASLRELVIHPMGFTLPQHWSWSGSTAIDRQLDSSDFRRFPVIFTHQRACYKPEFDQIQNDGVIVYRLTSSGEERDQTKFGRIINKRWRRPTYGVA
ncbi:hypothetical protein BJ165DRAFT_1499235 [Panaeolus papilionaceus]|nr:hypothetical protein BJ165DRAFT_1499235 [Panaeolus papilionaceus]